MKRIVSLVLALSMVLSMFSFAFAGTTLPDVEGTDYEAAVSALVELGIVNGYEDGTYRSDKTVTRAEMAKFLVVSAGLEGAAEVSKGATNFSDVAADHWATGYINVASQYGYINGYPEGTFAPDATVSYAEAVTMAIRVLGYKTVVEAKGTWPTNYIAKATELKVLEDVSYGRYTDGATRGNVALLMWNMLTTDMWDVISENENNGLSYGKTEDGAKMINKYFADYVYAGEEYEMTVANIVVDDGKVTIDLVSENDLPDELEADEIELAAGIDFLNLTGRTVSVLYNKKAEKIVMVTPSNNDRVIEGYRDELSGDKYVFSGDEELVWGEAASGDSDYVVSVLGTKKNVEYTTRYALNTSIIVDELKTKNDVVKVNGTLDLDEDVIVLIDGEWATAEDIEVGDVLTELVEEELYIVSRDIVTGSFDAVTEEKDTAEETYFVTVDGEEYSVVYGIQQVVEIDEDGEEGTPVDLADIIIDDESKYYGEDVTLYLNFLGEVEKIAFGEVEDKEETGHFYVLTNAPKAYWTVSDKNGETRYIELNGESYEIKSTVVSGDIPTTNVSGDVVYVTFDSKDRVTAIYEIPTDSGDISGDYTIKTYTSATEILDDYNYISGEHKVTSATTVVKITPVVTEEDDEEIVEYYEVETFKGASELEGVEYAVVAISKDDNTFANASYVFVWEDAKNTEKTHGIVEKYTKSNGIVYLTIDGTKYELDTVTDEWSGDNSATPDMYVGRAVEFIDNEDGINITMSYGADQLGDAAEVAEVEDGRIFNLSGDTYASFNPIDLSKYEDDMDDTRIFIVNVSETDDGYEFDSFEEVEFADVKVKKGDRIAINPKTVLPTNLDDAETILVIRGYEE